MAATEPAEKRRGEMEAMYQKIKESAFPNVPEMDVETLRSQLEKQAQGEGKIVVVDARTDDEANVSMIPSGTLRKKDFEDHIEDYVNHKVVCYCTIGFRSGKYAADLQKRGLEAFNLKGSILAWTHAGLPLVNAYDPVTGSSSEDKEAVTTKNVHVFADKWALQGDGYNAVYFPHGAPWGRVVWEQFQLMLPLWMRGTKKLIKDGEF
eukprot:SM000076S21764  [mRNA]  locus=s76:169839:171011:+ [translate_table: standard]